MLEITKMKLNHNLFFAAAILAAVSCGAPRNQEFQLHLLTTNDIHGCYFDSTYVNDGLRKSVFAINEAVDSIRTLYGKENVILIDGGDFLQGDNASYYFNYVETKKPHIFPRLAKYMKYDAVIAGNHDIETGHEVYDRIASDFKRAGIPFLGGNAIRNDNGEPYFPIYTIIKRQGIKIAVLGYTNANIKAWLDESLWSGMHFESLVPLVQEDVDRVIAKEKPHIVIVAVHSGTGEGDGTILESEALDLFNSLKGVTAIVGAHDHSPYFKTNEETVLINTGSHARNLGHVTIDISFKNKKVDEIRTEGSLIAIKENKVDKEMREAFHDDYLAVKNFTLREIGELKDTIDMKDSFLGMSAYINFLHSVCLRYSDADISIAAPLTARGVITPGRLTFNELFKLYQYENQLYLATMTGEEIKNYLEASYDGWIRTATTPYSHVLNVALNVDERYSTAKWSFKNASFNFDSMAGISYTVDVTKEYGERVTILSMADGSAFNPETTYKIALTSYRASGGGDLLKKAGIDQDDFDHRVYAKLPEIRKLMSQFIVECGTVTFEKISDPAVLGHWEFIPEEIVHPAIENDLDLIYSQE